MSDINKWNNFYKNQSAPDYPSLFARECLPSIDKDGILIDMGCGNGRDTDFFKLNGIHVIGIDSSPEAVNILLNKNIPCVLYDFTELPDWLSFDSPFFSKLMTVYYRFSLHSVPRDKAINSLSWAYKKLCEGGKVFIEARSVQDSLYGVGEQIGEHEFVHDHYRRFIDPTDLFEDLTYVGFTIDTINMEHNFAPYGDENPVIIRATGIK